MRYDVTGKDAWWIQSPSSALWQGHTSLLIQEKPGFWWYFYYGPYSMQLIFLGTTSLAKIDSDVKKGIEKWNTIYKNDIKKGKYNKLKYEENYTMSLRFSGNFTKCINLIKKDFNNYEKNHKIKTTKFRFGKNNKYKYKSKTYNEPYSMIISHKMPEYDILKCNCMHISTGVLRVGTLKKNNSKFYNALVYVQVKYSRPCAALDYMRKQNLGKMGFHYLFNIQGL